jgi:predicted neutral ceramidase superfamily lipid hydrolase
MYAENFIRVLNLLMQEDIVLAMNWENLSSLAGGNQGLCKLSSEILMFSLSLVVYNPWGKSTLKRYLMRLGNFVSWGCVAIVIVLILVLLKLTEQRPSKCRHGFFFAISLILYCNSCCWDALWSTFLVSGLKYCVLILLIIALNVIVTEKRQAEAARIRDKYPDRIPVWYL